MGIYSRILMTGKKTVLLVEDNPDDEVLALRALRMNGIEEGVSVVRDGAEALDFLFGRGEYSDRSPDLLPTVVLLDLNLPKINGLEVLRQLRAHEETRYLPVVILTTSKEEQDMISGYSFGANSFICKPVDYDQFIQANQNAFIGLALNPCQTVPINLNFQVLLRRLDAVPSSTPLVCAEVALPSWQGEHAC